jgi:large subunit ribosomal protein L21
MQPYAVVESGGKQYRVAAGDTLKVERLDAETGATVEVTPVLALSDGTTLRIGKPSVQGAAVKASVVDHIRGEKVVAFRKKRRKGYQRKVGHRQELTVLKVESVQ